MKRVFSFLSALVLSATLFSCSNDDNYADVSNLVGGYTMVNGYESDAAVVFGADGRAIQNPYYPLPYQTVGYANLWQGTRLLTVNNAYSLKEISNQTKKIENQQFYTSFVGGNAKKVVNFITDDKVARATPLNEVKQAGVRFFNLSSDEVIATVQFNEKPLLKEFVNREQDSEITAIVTQEFKGIEANTYSISVTDKQGKVLATRDNVILKPSQFYSLILIGSKDNKDKPYHIGLINQAVR